MSDIIFISYRQLAFIVITLALAFSIIIIILTSQANIGNIVLSQPTFDVTQPSELESTNESIAQVQTLQQEQSPKQESTTKTDIHPSEQDLFLQEMNAKAQEWFPIAKEFFLNSPTFSYDGLPDVEVETLFISENELVFKFKFYSLHPGYGDRSTAPIPEQKTFHVMRVTVRDGIIVSALTDNKYDEIHKRYDLFALEIKE